MSIKTLGAVLIIDDTPTNLKVLVESLTQAGFETYVAIDGKSALDQLNHIHPDLILLDVMMPGIDGFETCRRLKQNPDLCDIPVIFMTALSETVDKVQGFEVGAVDYITKPFQHEEVLARVQTHLTLRCLQRDLEVANTTLEQKVAERTDALQKALAEVERLKNHLQAENAYLKEEIQQTHDTHTIVHQSPVMKQTLNQVAQVAPTDATVLLLGETGTGKELLAHAVHNLSDRKNQSLIKVNCAALPVNLIESELFGHEKGAFTSALSRKQGRFELAHHGTLFLDEIGDLPLELQAKLLRVLQEGEFERLGGTQTHRVDVRIIAATNRNLESAVSEGTFREDLFYRLHVFPIQSPALRDRTEDIPLLVHHFVQHFAQRFNKQIDTVSETVMQTLKAYAWPGNVRELQNVIERAVILTQDTTFDLGGWYPQVENLPASDFSSLQDNERVHILAALNKTHWRIGGERGAAYLLGLKRTTLLSRMKKLGINTRP